MRKDGAGDAAEEMGGSVKVQAAAPPPAWDCRVRERAEKHCVCVCAHACVAGGTVDVFTWNHKPI